MNNSLMAQSEGNSVERALEFAEKIIGKSYLRQLSYGKILPMSFEETDISLAQNACFWRLSRLVVNKSEHLSEQLTTIMNVANTVGGSVVTIIKSKNASLDIILGVVSKENRGQDPKSRERAAATLEAFSSALMGNLSGSEFTPVSEAELNTFQSCIMNESKVASSISGIPSFRDKNQQDILNYAQGIEHLFDSMNGRDFTIISIADPLTPNEIDRIAEGYELIYSQLSSMLKTQVTYNETNSQSLSAAQTTGIVNNITKGVSLTQTQTDSKSKSSSYSKGVNLGVSFLVSAGYNASSSSGSSTSSSYGSGKTQNFSEGRSTSSSDTRSVGMSKSSGSSIQMGCENRAVQSMLDKINKQLARLELCRSFGAFKCAAYVLSSEESTTVSAANNFSALMRAEGSYIEGAAINIWSEEQPVKSIVSALNYFTHPRFKLTGTSSEQTLILSPASITTGKEATLLLGLPRQSVCGVPVIEMTPFGRNPPPLTQSQNCISLGQLSHMSRDESKSVLLDTSSLASHTFITGSTGSGKSNTVYRILNELEEKGIPFLVIEPAKGEYKHALAHCNNISVFGTNPNKTPMLRINPFSFPKDIHVLEHIDRLVEIFNVCWPMYAAMPAVLKDAVECAYKACGWNLDTSVNRCGFPLFPTFIDVLKWLHRVIESSEFSGEVKSNYIGALVTRVKSLTNGINGQIFVCNEISGNALFDRNCIIDISRVASMETKSMIMGILVMKLQEYRMSDGGINRKLRHITVLEEAHHLLKRTSSEQSAEGANLLGKSVEMLSNAIAEMRTYGEGFIIADQSPSMLDLSAIRNTNTKIILRLPNLADRELSGRAAGLKDEQIAELAKLPTGVAAVYQNNWLEPVLCHVPKEEPDPDNMYEYRPEDVPKPDTLKQDIIYAIFHKTVKEDLNLDMDLLKRRIIASRLAADLKLEIINALNTGGVDMERAAPAVAGLFNTEDILANNVNARDIDEWNKILVDGADFPLKEMSQRCQSMVLFCIVSERYKKSDPERLEAWVEHMNGRLLQ